VSILFYSLFLLLKQYRGGRVAAAGADIESAFANASYMPALPVAINLRTTLDTMAFAGLGEFTHAFSWLAGIREPERRRTHQ
jgi:hypothetical protein